MVIINHSYGKPDKAKKALFIFCNSLSPYVSNPDYIYIYSDP